MPKVNKYRLLLCLNTFCLCLLLLAPITKNVWPSEIETKIKTLINKLKDQSKDVRWAAAKTLGEIGPEANAAVPALIEALKDEDKNVLWNAVTALGKIGPGANAAVPALIEALKDEDKDVRWAAAKTLGEIGPGANAAVPALIEAFKDEDKDVRMAASLAEILIGPAAKETIPALVEALKDKNKHVSGAAWQALVEIGPEATVAVPTLREVLKELDNYFPRGYREELKAVPKFLMEIGPKAKDAVPTLENKNIYVRWATAKTLGEIGPEAKAAAVPTLIEALKNKDKDVRWAAAKTLGEIGPGANAAVPALIEALKDHNRFVRYTAVWALGEIDPEATVAVPVLIEAFKDKDEGVRWISIIVLGKIGPEARDAMSALIEALKDESKHVRYVAAQALGKIDPEATVAVPVLIEALKDEDKDVRWAAAGALGEIGPEAQPAVPALIEALKDKNEGVRKAAAWALEKLATSLRDTKAIDMIKDLKVAKEALSANPELNEQEKTVRRAIEYLEEIKPPWWENIWHWVNKNRINKTIGIAVPLYLLWVMAWLIVFWLRPLALLQTNQALKSLNYKLPGWAGGITLPLRFLLFVGFLNYRPRVLDAWVKAYISTCRENFSKKPTVSDRQIHISTPVEFNRQTVPGLTCKQLQLTFVRQIVCLLIWGEGGSGKTSLACQIAKWAMAEDKQARLCKHLMLPVLIEHELSSKEDQSAFINAVGRQLQAETDQPNSIPKELLERLLRQRRVLVIVDHLSEMSEPTRTQINLYHLDFPANAFIVTSRLEEALGGIAKTSIKPLRVSGNQLSSFLHAYLTQKGKRDQFDDPEFFNACRRLSEMVGDRDITLLLAKLFAEQMIVLKEGITDDKLPDNIPDLMLSYLNELNRNVRNEYRLENRTIHRYAKVLAWESLKKTFRPASVLIDDAVTALAQENANDQLVYIENRLRLIKTEQPAEDRFTFLLDPLAEYLAALHLLNLCGYNEESWNNFLAEVDRKEGAPEAIKGFLLAVRDCIIAKAEETNVPDFVADELAKRAGLDSK